MKIQATMHKTNKLQNIQHSKIPNQYGYTKNENYMLAALERHEAEQYCIAMKKTFFALSLDSASAFNVLNR